MSMGVPERLALLMQTSGAPKREMRKCGSQTQQEMMGRCPNRTSGSPCLIMRVRYPFILNDRCMSHTHSKLLPRLQIGARGLGSRRARAGRHLVNSSPHKV